MPRKRLQLFILSAHPMKVDIHTCLIEYACLNHIKRTVLQIFRLTFAGRLESEEREVECDEPLMLLDIFQ